MRDDHLQDLIFKAQEIAYRSMMNNRHGALLISNRDIVEYSCNEFPKHAEHNVLKKYRRRNAENLVMVVVVRTSPTGKLGNSRPCNMCIARMKQANIKAVIYTTGDSEIYKIERPESMELKHISSGYSHRQSLGGKTCLIR